MDREGPEARVLGPREGATLDTVDVAEAVAVVDTREVEEVMVCYTLTLCMWELYASSRL